MPQLRIIHIALCIGAASITAVLAALRSFGPAASAPLPEMVGWVLLGLSATTIVGAAVLRSTIQAMEGGVTEESWLAANRGRMVALWAACEGGVVAASMALFLGASPLVAGALAAGGLGFMASQSPGTLAGH